LLCGRAGRRTSPAASLNRQLAEDSAILHVSIARVKPGQVARLRAWLDELQTRADEVRETFAAEGTSHEQGFILDVGGEQLLVYASECEDYAAAGEAFSRSTLPIDAQHRQIMPELIEPLDIAPAFDIRATGQPDQ
jgi:hypothetical protein